MLRPCSFNPFDVSLPSPLIPSIPMSEPLSPQIPSIPMSMSPSPKQSTLPEITASLSVPEIPSAISPDQPQEPSLQAISDSDEEMDLPLEPEEPESPPIHPSLEDEPHLPRLFTNSDDDEPRNPMPSVSNSEIPRPSTQPSLEDSPEEPAEAANDFPPPSSPSFEPPEQFSDPSQSPAVSNSNPSPSPHASNSIESLPQMVVLDTDDDEESQSQHVHSVQRTLLRTGRLVSFESRSVMNEFGSPKNTMDARPPSPSPELLDDPVPDPAVDVQCLSSDSDSAPDSDEPIGNIELPELPAFLDVPIVMDPKVPVVDLGPQLELPQLAEMVPPDQLVIPDLPQDSLHVPPLPVIQEPEVVSKWFLFLTAGCYSKKLSRISEQNISVTLSFNFFLLDFKDDFAQYDNHNICLLASKTTAFLTVQSVLALFLVYPSQFLGWHPALMSFLFRILCGLQVMCSNEMVN